jgi:hypothetical protein
MSTLPDQVLIDLDRELKAAREAKRDDLCKEIVAKIHAINPRRWIGGAIKLRVLADPEIGLYGGASRSEQISLQQLVELAEYDSRLCIQIEEAAKRIPTLEEFTRRAIENESAVLAMLAERDALEAAVNASGDEKMGSEEAFTAFVEETAEKIIAIDRKLASIVCLTSVGIVAQVDLLAKWADRHCFCHPDDSRHEDQEGDVVEMLVSSIGAGIRRRRGGEQVGAA